MFKYLLNSSQILVVFQGNILPISYVLLLKKNDNFYLGSVGMLILWFDDSFDWRKRCSYPSSATCQDMWDLSKKQFSSSEKMTGSTCWIKKHIKFINKILRYVNSQQQIMEEYFNMISRTQALTIRLRGLTRSYQFLIFQAENVIRQQ